MIEVENLRMELPGFTMQDISLSIREKEFFTLLGPTGAGKTLLLEAIAGVLPVTGGAIRINGKDVTSFPPEKRGVGIVYQDYALFPHLSVWNNVIFGLRYIRSDSGETKEWTGWLMERLGIKHLTNRSVVNLSGGEKQRVALTRAIAVRPSVLLLDEPLSALDPNFREEIRELLKKLHQELDITFLMVTHDFAEALFLSERAAILNQGKIEQVGPVSEVFRQPSSPFVAEFVGMKNIFPARFEGNKAILNGLELQMSNPSFKNGKYVAVRPEDIAITDAVSEGENINVFRGRVCEWTDRAGYYEVSVKTGSLVFKTDLTRRDFLDRRFHEKPEVCLSILSSAIHVF